MIDRSWWSIAWQSALWILGMALVMGWLARSRLRPRPAEHSRRLAHPLSTFIIGLVCAIFFTGLTIAFNISSDSTPHWWTSAIFMGFALLSIPILLDYLFARYELLDEGMTFRKLIVGRKHLYWSELYSVKYSSIMKWFRLETRTGEVVRISVMLMGLPEFARLLLAHAPPEAIEQGTRPVLQATAGGNPPSIWM